MVTFASLALLGIALTLPFYFLSVLEDSGASSNSAAPSMLVKERKTSQNLRVHQSSTLLIDDFSSSSRYSQQHINSVGGYTDDDATAVSDVISGGQLVLTTRAGTYWFSIFGASPGCRDTTAYAAIQFTVTAPAGTNFVVNLVGYNPSCTSLVVNSRVSVANFASFSGSPTVVTIPLSSFPNLSASRASVHHVALESFTPVGVVVRLDNIGLTASSPPPPPPPPPPPGTVLRIDDFASVPRYSTQHVNLLGGYTDDDSTMVSDVISSGGLVLSSRAGSYWYSVFGSSSPCIDTSQYRSINMDLTAASGTTFTINLVAYNAACSSLVLNSRVNTARFVSFSGSQVSFSLPLNSFPSLSGSRRSLHHIAIESISPPNAVIRLDNIMFTNTTPSSDLVGNLQFSGYQWVVKSASVDTPGPNSWSPNNVFVGADGLHLRIVPTGGGGFSCSEVVSQNSFGYGRYSWVVSTPVDSSNLDPWVVFGLFTWSDDPSYWNREIDIEYSQWGNAAAVNEGGFSVQPGHTSVFNQPAGLTNTIQSFVWSSTSVVFESRRSDGSLVSTFTYTGADIPVPGPEKVRMNLWLFQGHAPTVTRTYEVVISSFSFTPL